MSSLYPVKKEAPETHTTEFDILKASHKFFRSGDEDVSKSWDAQLAKKYEDSLFKEFAVCNLKHYKSGNIALRWRTEDEVLSGAGELTCSNTRCTFYDCQNDAIPSASKEARSKAPKLTTMELPFSYVEQGETEVREVMVKVVLCERCVKKLMWKREREKKDKQEATLSGREGPLQEAEPDSRATRSGSRRRVKRTDDRSHKSVRKRGTTRSISPRRHRIIPLIDSD